MLKRKFNFILLIILPILFLTGCALFQDPSDQYWQNLTPDQKARVIIGGLQSKLGIAFDNAKLYVDLHPSLRDDWQKKVIPLFDIANKAIKDQNDLGKDG